MKRVICDTCRKEVEPDSYGVAPNGWFAIQERGNYNSGGNADYCSKLCVIDAMQAEPLTPRATSEPATAAA